MERKALGASIYAPPNIQNLFKQDKGKENIQNVIKQDKGKATRLLSRLKWKAESLRASYDRAVAIYHAEIDNEGYIDRRGEALFPFVLGMGTKHAESMFKVDFFEFYTLLERYLTLCLSLFNISISGAAPQSNVNALRLITSSDYARRRPEAKHRFHANLLAALDDATNPLHEAFSNQDIRIQLGLAKDYRNHWKDADEKLVKNQGLPEPEHERRKAVELGDLDLKIMLQAILAGCEHALNIVHGRPNNPLNGGVSTTSDLEIGYYNMEVEMEMDGPLEYMDDPMDLD